MHVNVVSRFIFLAWLNSLRFGEPKTSADERYMRERTNYEAVNGDEPPSLLILLTPFGTDRCRDE